MAMIAITTNSSISVNPEFLGTLFFRVCIAALQGQKVVAKSDRRDRRGDGLMMGSNAEASSASAFVAQRRVDVPPVSRASLSPEAWLPGNDTQATGEVDKPAAGNDRRGNLRT
jgi:hypothetical protein